MQNRKKIFVWLEVGPVLVLCAEGEGREGSKVGQDKMRSRSHRREQTTEGSRWVSAAGQTQKRSGSGEGTWEQAEKSMALCSRKDSHLLLKPQGISEDRQQTVAGGLCQAVGIPPATSTPSPCPQPSVPES